jgi:hypothetical protein
MVGEIVNVLVDAGFSIDRVLEPGLTDAQRTAHPHKASWVDRYVGTLIIRALPLAA